MSRLAHAATLACTALLFAAQCARAGQASPAADTDRMTTLDFATGKVTHCDFGKPRTAEQAAADDKKIKVGFVTLHVDSCVWGDMRASDAPNAWVIYRNGTDVACRVDAGEAPVKDPGPGAYAAYLRTTAMAEVQDISNDVQKIDGKSWRHEIVQGTSQARPPAVAGTVNRTHNWTWYGPDKLVSLTCFGPPDAITQNTPQMQALAASVHVNP